MNHPLNFIIKTLFFICLTAVLIIYYQGYDLSIDWEVTTTGEFMPFEAWSMDNGLISHKITGEKILLTENYQGSEIKNKIGTAHLFVALSWIGVCIVLATASYFKRIGFFITIGLFALFINRLNLFEVGLFGITSRLVLLIPFVSIAGPLVYFSEYQKNIAFHWRLLSLILISIVLFTGVKDEALFTHHFIAHSLFGYLVCGIFFIFAIVEEPIFAILLLISRGKGSKDNHLHFIVLSLIYLGNLSLYYLSKSGYFPNSFYFFDPYILLAFTTIIGLFTLRFKFDFLSVYVSGSMFYNLLAGLGIIFLSMVGLAMFYGIDGIYQGFHYFILYSHLGFGVFFFLYLLINFIDPLVKGLPVFRIAYKEQNFPYLSARLGGLAAVLGFYFLSSQEGYNLIRSGYYNYLGDKEQYLGNERLAQEYFENAAFLGTRTHYPNYQTGIKNRKKGNSYASKVAFENASMRFGSPYAIVNYGNLDKDLNPNKVQAKYEEALRTFSSGELRNNLGIVHLQKGNLDRALDEFRKADPEDRWNSAPLINKWNVYALTGAVDKVILRKDYQKVHYGLRANIIASSDTSHALSFEYDNLDQAYSLHQKAYLLNSVLFLNDDSIASKVTKHIDQSIDGDFNTRLRKGLALYHYRRGEVNQAFKMLNYLQANVNRFYKGEFYDIAGKFALDQQALRLSLDYFNKAIEYGSTSSRFSKIEALAALGDTMEIITTSSDILKVDAGLTNEVNIILEKLEHFSFPETKNDVPLSNDILNLSDDMLVQMAGKNAFDEQAVLAAIDELTSRGNDQGYNLLLQSIEINPYALELLKAYALYALDWNLIEYASSTLERIESIASPKEYELFLKIYNKKLEELEKSIW